MKFLDISDIIKPSKAQRVSILTPQQFPNTPINSSFTALLFLHFFDSLQHLLSPCLYGQEDHCNEGGYK
jgi:hypothetical protein